MPDLTPEQIVMLNEFGEANAWANNFQCAPAEFVAKYHIEARRVGSLWVTMIPGLDWAFFNRISGLGAGEPATESMLDDAIAVLQNAGCKNYMAQVHPAAQPAELSNWLESRELKRSRNWAKVYRDNTPAPIVHTDLRIESVGAEYADAYAEVVLAAFEMPKELTPWVTGTFGKPGWLQYLGFDGDKPVTAGAMHVDGETCWLGFGSTLETHRKRGGQGAIFARRIADGLKLGCKWFVTETGEDTLENPNPSYHNMIRTGFKLAYLRPNFVHQQG